MVIYQPVQVDAIAGLSLEDLYCICTNDPINIDEQGISEALDEDLAGAFE